MAAHPAKKAKMENGSSGIGPMVTGGTVSWDRGGEPFFSMGAGTLRVPMAMHATHREKLCEVLRKRPEVGAGAVILLQGGKEASVYDTDTNWDFKQESNFQYLFGVKEPDCYAALRVHDARAVLFVPRMEKMYQAWCGPIKPPAWFQKAYGVHEAAHTDEIVQTLRELGAKELLCVRGSPNRDSGLQLEEPNFDGKDQFGFNQRGSGALWDELNEIRSVKDEEELKILQWVNDVSAEAHLETMRAVQGGQREHLAEATFKYKAALRGCFRVGYSCICGSGRRNAILHYGHAAEPNSELVQAGSLRLLDMGAEYHGYSADVTCSFPVSGRFSRPQRIVYEAVWDAVLAVERVLQPGVCYKDMHRLAQRTLLERMTSAGLFVGSVEDMMAAGLMFHFMPHGLGHQLGLDVHDVGGYPPGEFRKDDPSVQENLRLGRKVKENMVLTVEPGFYFIDYLIEEALADTKKGGFINQEVLHEFWADVGGVRIEDDVVITSNGCRVLTCVPRTVEEIEAVMAGGAWQVSAACCRSYTAGSKM
ncbi:PEPD [Symbiodinium natans]|uniref:Xaa-Pro dipeptidase n=1 Tax=Symbiodinium natans TaxID=878477 RepID=A0A812KJQ6_9DINO|nr:PEPD [Symbiodinium natans]